MSALLPVGLLAARASSGAVLLTLATVVNASCGLVVSALLARALGPAVVGTYAFALALSEIVHLLTDWSIGTAIVQARDDLPRLLETALTLGLVLGLGLIGLCLLLVPLLWLAFSPVVAALFVALAVVRLFQLLADCFGAVLERDLRYGRFTAVRFLAVALAQISALSLAWAGAGVWALFAREAVHIAGLFLGMWLASGRPLRLAVARPTLRHLALFGGGMTVARLGELVFHRLDNAVVGLLWGPRELGLYDEAYRFSEIGHRLTGPAVIQVALAAYARLQTRPAERVRAFQFVQESVVRLLPPLFLALGLGARDLLWLLYGEQWLDAAPILQMLAVYATVIPLFEHTKQLLYSQGAVGTMIRIRVFQLALYIPCLLALTARWGGVGAALAVNLGLVAASLAQARAAGRYIDASWPAQRAVYGRPLLATALGALAFLAWTALGPRGWHPQGEALVRLLLPALVYTLAIIGLDWERTVPRAGAVLRLLLLRPAAETGAPAPAGR